MPLEFSWGLREVDDAIGSGIGGRLVVVSARPSNGKTTWLFSWVNSLYADPMTMLHLRALCFWIERAVELSYWTWAALRAGVGLDAVVKGHWDILPAGAHAALDLDREQLLWRAHESESFIRFADQERPTVADVVAAVERHKPNVLVLDYLQRIKPEPRQTKFEAIGEAATVLQQLAVRQGVLVVVGSQLKRRGDGVFDKYLPPHLEDFKLSGEIEENADVALGLYRPLKRMTHKEKEEVRDGLVDLSAWSYPNTMAVKVLKHRYWGEAADRLVRVQCQDGRITDAPRLGGPPLESGDAWEERAPF